MCMHQLAKRESENPDPLEMQTECAGPGRWPEICGVSLKHVDHDHRMVMGLTFRDMACG